MSSAIRIRAAIVACAALAAVPAASHAIVSSNTNGFPFDGLNINEFIGAEDFYALNYTGSRAVLANVEAGHIWDGHDDTSAHLVTNPLFNTASFYPGTVSQYINDPSIGTHESLYDWHATMVGHVLGGFGSFDYGFILQDGQGNHYNTAWGYGIAPFATIWSAAIASQFDPTPGVDFSGSFEITSQSFTYAYKTTMQTGVNGRKADVVNSSWGYDDPDGSVNETKIIDALAYTNHQTVVIAAGNHDTGNPAVGGPASGYNSISVGALASDTSTPYYGHVADFSNHGLNDFTNPKLPPKYATVPQSRVAVDLAAPGDNLTLAAYLGLTGGHTSNSQFNLDPATLASTGNYFVDVGGTSFASPIVAAAASLVVDAGYDRFGGGNAVDGRVIKAVLLNSASKVQGWNNAQTTDTAGVIRTTQALDASTGAGALNLHHALNQYLGGETDVPGLSAPTAAVAAGGWDFAVATAGVDNDYRLAGTLTAGVPLAVTLDWFANRAYDDATQTAEDVSFADLDLEVWLMMNGAPTQLVATSASAYSNVEHLAFDLPMTGEYLLRVHYYADAYNATDPAAWAGEEYALAWMTPEPSTPLLLFAAGVTAAARRRSRRVLTPLSSPAKIAAHSPEEWQSG